MLKPFIVISPRRRRFVVVARVVLGRRRARRRSLGGIRGRRRRRRRRQLRRSRGAVRFNVASLYPLLYRLEKRNWIRGRWIEKSGQRRRRYYRLTPAGKKMLTKQRHGWAEFVAAVKLITATQHA